VEKTTPYSPQVSLNVRTNFLVPVTSTGGFFNTRGILRQNTLPSTLRRVHRAPWGCNAAVALGWAPKRPSVGPCVPLCGCGSCSYGNIMLLLRCYSLPV